LSVRAFVRRLVRRPRWGNLRRRRPFSESFGYERGTPVDRWYIERFLHEHADEIRGEVLEVGEPRYTMRFGGGRVTRSHVVDVDAANRGATIVADLCEPGSLPRAAFDCAVVTQTLQFLPDVDAAVANLFESLRPGGTLLVTAPAVSRLEPGLRDRDLWRFGPAGLAQVLRRGCPGAEIAVVGRGNLVAAVAALEGVAAEELAGADLHGIDPDFPLVVCGRVRKGD
jgi:hypothetical protein